ncbi:hypothetical protein BGP76_19305 [Reichenbachiella sp. MSK19-1]|nr:hypothetical protein BGP76_19305 [Reichenbachiella sp. MSK19-1]
MERFVSSLREVLEVGLPGIKAQHIMAPARMSEVKRTFAHKTPPRESAVLILFYPEDGQVKFPLIVRPVYQGVHSGQIALPGGKQEEEDGDLAVTALRETHEEIGVPAQQVKMIGKLSRHYIPPSNFNIEPYLGYVTEKPVFVKDQIEVEEILEVDLADIQNADLRKKMWIKPYEGVQIEAPYFDIQERVVWGATAMILSELSELIKKTTYGNE